VVGANSQINQARNQSCAYVAIRGHVPCGNASGVLGNPSPGSTLQNRVRTLHDRNAVMSQNSMPGRRMCPLAITVVTPQSAARIPSTRASVPTPGSTSALSHGTAKATRQTRANVILRMGSSPRPTPLFSRIALEPFPNAQTHRTQEQPRGCPLSQRRARDRSASRDDEDCGGRQVSGAEDGRGAFGDRCGHGREEQGGELPLPEATPR